MACTEKHEAAYSRKFICVKKAGFLHKKAAFLQKYIL